MILRGCGMAGVALLGWWLWSRHNKELKPWGDISGILAILCFPWIAVSLCVLGVVILAPSELRPPH
jgi:cytochrome bd-type quinol oxidase subunit 1